MLQDFISWFTNKYRQQAREHGIAHAARNLRKQGVPVQFAVRILVGR